ncbi:MAG: hypothetical protein IT245_05820 [Bacteroidia bacterium]|nr:hypothetical protein [Bacteroidia bacterium]
MKNTTLILLSLFFVTACQLATFTERPGVSRDAFPKDMYGVYMNIEKSNGIKDTHILTVDSTGANIDDPILSKIVNIKDSNNTLSHLGDYHYLNVKDSDSAGNYTYFVYPFEYDSKNLWVYKIILSDKSLKRMAKCGLRPSGKREGEYVMDNMAFKKYVEKYLKKKDAIRFKKIK